MTASSALTECLDRMRAAEMPRPLIARFRRQYQAWRQGVTGRVPLDEVSTLGPGDLVDADGLPAPDPQHAAALLHRLVCIKLNGGLGTTMHLARAKSLIEVRPPRSFLDLIAGQISHLRAESGARLPLLLMNSYRTRDDSLAALADFANPDALPLDFVQHRVPRVDARTGQPSSAPGDAAWAPPGHGDVFLALHTSGLLDRLLAGGYRYAFISNGDNLGATVSLPLLADFAERGRPFAMEVTPKTAADRKGGTLVWRGGRLFLLERAMVAPDEMDGFLDLERFPVFNTNTLWVDLMAARVALHGGLLELPLIVNRKRVHDRPVLQFETAMGAAIGCFSHTAGYRVSRRRFAPVKTTDDLLAVRSDAFALDPSGALQPHPDRPAAWGPPVVTLDGEHYARLADFEARCPHPLGLRRCRSLTVEGPVRFGRGVRCEGQVRLIADAEAVAPDGQVFTAGAWRWADGGWRAVGEAQR